MKNNQFKLSFPSLIIFSLTLCTMLCFLAVLWQMTQLTFRIETELLNHHSFLVMESFLQQFSKLIFTVIFLLWLGLVNMLFVVKRSREMRKKLFNKTSIVNLLHKVTRAANESKSSNEAYKEVLEIICNYMKWPIGHVYVQSRKNMQVMVSAGIWRSPESRPYQKFRDASNKIKFKEGEGVIGLAFQTKKPVWIKDVDRDQQFKRAALAQSEGFKSILVFPVLVGNQVVSILEFYSRESCEEGDEIVKLMGNVGVQLGRVIERERASEQLKNEKNIAVQLGKKALLSSEAKSTFLAGMSHEIRTPMNAILGFSDLLTRTELDETQFKYIQTIQSSGTLLMSIINDILDFSKFESGKMQLESINFNIEYLVHDVFKMVMERIANKPIDTFVDIAEDVPRYLLGDPTRLRQVFLNLLGNAIKFTSDGEIGVIIRRNNALVSEDNIGLLCIVKDTGIGVSEDKHRLIFESFSQADQSTTRNFGGTGLGLTICKSIVEAMGGRIRIESTANVGSKFIFEIILPKGKSLTESEIYPLSLDQIKNKKVAIVEDNDKNREILINYCEQIGMDVVFVAKSGESCLQKLDSMASICVFPDVLLTDMLMPGMDGYALIDKIRKNDNWKKLRFVAVSSDARVGITKEAQEKGFHGFLPKPIIRDELKNVIAVVLGDQREKKSIITRHSAEEMHCKGIKVLVAEDSFPNQELMKAYFKNLGCDGEFAENGAEAIEMIKKNSYDLCFMDLQMPVMGGIEATLKIRKDISKELPIIALTANVMKEAYEKCLKAGMNDFLPKPVDMESLKKKIVGVVKN